MKILSMLLIFGLSLNLFAQANRRQQKAIQQNQQIQMNNPQLQNNSEERQELRNIMENTEAREQLLEAMKLNCASPAVKVADACVCPTAGAWVPDGANGCRCTLTGNVNSSSCTCNAGQPAASSPNSCPVGPTSCSAEDGLVLNPGTNQCDCMENMGYAKVGTSCTNCWLLTPAQEIKNGTCSPCTGATPVFNASLSKCEAVTTSCDSSMGLVLNPATNACECNNSAKYYGQPTSCQLCTIDVVFNACPNAIQCLTGQEIVEFPTGTYNCYDECTPPAVRVTNALGTSCANECPLTGNVNDDVTPCVCNDGEAVNGICPDAVTCTITGANDNCECELPTVLNDEGTACREQDVLDPLDLDPLDPNPNPNPTPTTTGGGSSGGDDGCDDDGSVCTKTDHLDST